MFLIRLFREITILILFILLVNYTIFSGAYSMVIAILLISVITLSFTIYYYRIHSKKVEIS